MPLVNQEKRRSRRTISMLVSSPKPPGRGIGCARFARDAPARERRPLGSSPGGARHSPPPRRAAGKDPEFGVVRLSAGTSAFSVIRAAARYTPFAALRAAVPTRGRRSLASGAIWTVGVPARGCICAATGRRSAFPCLRGGPGRDRWPELHFACGGLTAELRASKPSRVALDDEDIGQLAHLQGAELVGREFGHRRGLR